MTGEEWTIEDENMMCWVDQKLKGGAINDRRKVANSVLECEERHTHTHNDTKGSKKKKKKKGWGGGVLGWVHFSGFFLYF